MGVTKCFLIEFKAHSEMESMSDKVKGAKNLKLDRSRKYGKKPTKC